MSQKRDFEGLYTVYLTRDLKVKCVWGQGQRLPHQGQRLLDQGQGSHGQRQISTAYSMVHLQVISSHLPVTQCYDTGKWALTNVKLLHFASV